MRRSLALVALAVTAAGCGLVSSYPRGAYFPLPGNPETVAVSRTLYRAAQAAGDDPERYSFALFESSQATGYAAEDATFYFSETLAPLPQPPPGGAPPPPPRPGARAPGPRARAPRARRRLRAALPRARHALARAVQER